MHNLPHSLSFLDHRLTSHRGECWDPTRVLLGKVLLKAKATYSSQMDLWTMCMVSRPHPESHPWLVLGLMSLLSFMQRRLRPMVSELKINESRIWTLLGLVIF